MSGKLKILAALNVVGWAVVIPLLVSSLLNPLLDFRDWPGSGLLGRPAQDVRLAPLGPGAETAPPSGPSSRGSLPDPAALTGGPAPGPLLPGARAIVPGLVDPSVGSPGFGGAPGFTPQRTGAAGAPRPVLPADPGVGFAVVPVPGAGPVLVPNLITSEPEVPSDSAPGSAGPVAETPPDSTPLSAPPLADAAPKSPAPEIPQGPVAAMAPGQTAATPAPAKPEPKPKPKPKPKPVKTPKPVKPPRPAATPKPGSTPPPAATAKPTPDAGQATGAAAPPPAAPPAPGGPGHHHDHDPASDAPVADRAPKHPGPQTDHEIGPDPG